MSRIYSQYLADIVECCEHIREYVTGFTFEEFVADRKTVDAVVRNLEIIGEAVKSLPNEIRETEPHIDWKKIAGFRDVIAHHYFDIDYDRVWNIIQKKLPELGTATKTMLKRTLVAEADDIDE